MDSKVINDSFKSPKDKKYISDKIYNILNEQISIELNASQLYKSIATWCDKVGYIGAASYFNKHSDEERGHMNKLYEYSLDRNCNPITPSVKEQPSTFKDLKDVLEKALQHEELVENSYKKAIEIAWSEKDYTTFTFLQWYLNEQIEEIKTFVNLLDRLCIIGYDKQGMYFIDKSMKI